MSCQGQCRKIEERGDGYGKGVEHQMSVRDRG